MKTESFLAGSARVKTTPPLGTRINGDFITHYAQYVHDDLYAKSLVFKSADTLVAIVVVDICIMPGDFLDGVKESITRETRIPASHILISGTHTHAAGSVADVHLGSVDVAYSKMLPGLILESVLMAIRNLVPAKIGFGRVDAPEHVLCRRYIMRKEYTAFNPVSGGADQIKTNPFGAAHLIRESSAPTDPQLSYLAVKGLDNSWIGLLGNYSLHYVGDWDNGTISADYFGVFAEALCTKLQAGEAFVGMMSNGTSGDVNIWDFQNGDRYPSGKFEKSRLIGTDLAEKIFHDLPGISWQANPSLSACYEEIEIDLVKPSAEELLAARELVSEADFENIIVDQNGLRQIYAREQFLLDQFPPTNFCPVQAIRIGNGTIGGLAGEFFSETGLFLKEKKTTEHYFTITMANGNLGYIPPAHEIAKGGYETWRCRYSCLAPGAEEKIRERLLLLIKKL